MDGGHWIPVATLGLIAAIVVGILYGSGVFGGGGSGVSSQALREAAHARTEEFLEHVLAGRHGEAAALVRLPGRDAAEGVIAQRLQSEPALRGLSGGSLGHYSRRNGTAIVSGSLRTGEEQVGVEVHLSRADEAWWIAELVLAGRPVISGSTIGDG